MPYKYKAQAPTTGSNGGWGQAPGMMQENCRTLDSPRQGGAAAQAFYTLQRRKDRRLVALEDMY